MAGGAVLVEPANEMRAGFPARVPWHRCTPPDTRETTLRRPVSWLAEWGNPRSPRLLGAYGTNGIRGENSAYSCGGSRGTGVAPIHAFPFQPLRVTVAWAKPTTGAAPGYST